ARRRGVQRARHDILARARLSLDEKRGVGGGDALEDRVDATHFQAAALKLAKRRSIGNSEERLSGSLDSKGAVAGADHGPRLHQRFLNPHIRDMGAVRASAIFDQDALRSHADLTMDSGDGGIGETKMRPGRGPNTREAIVDGHALSARGTVNDDEID